MSGEEHQIIGVCRFSYPSLGGFAGPKRSIEETEARLYRPRRLAQRFAMFEALTLPSLAAQTDDGFTLVVLIGRGLPLRHKNRLRELAETYPFLTISQQDPAGPLASARKAFRRGLRDGTRFVTGFRIDDDDAVAIDYISRTRSIADGLLTQGWADEDAPAAIAFHRGIYWNLKSPEQPFFDFREKAPLGLASAMLTKVDAQANIFRWNHRNLSAHVRVWSDPTDQMFLRTLHQTNNSERKVPPAAEPIDTEDTLEMLGPRFGIDPSAAVALMEDGA